MTTKETAGSSEKGLSLTTQHSPAGLSVWGADFERAQRMASALCSAALFPQQFKDVGSCLILIEYSQRLGMSPLEVAQNVDIIHGKPTWKSSYLLQCIAQVYEDYEFVEGTDGKVRLPDGRELENRTCKLVAKLPNGRVREGATISYRMAVEQGWWGRKDSKWPVMGEQMLIYRAAAFFDRKWPTGRSLGLRPADEVRDIEDVTVFDPKGNVITPVTETAANGASAAEKIRAAQNRKGTESESESKSKKKEAAPTPPPVTTPPPAQPDPNDDNPLGGDDEDWTD